MVGKEQQINVSCFGRYAHCSVYLDILLAINKYGMPVWDRIIKNAKLVSWYSWETWKEVGAPSHMFPVVCHMTLSNQFELIFCCKSFFELKMLMDFWNVITSQITFLLKTISFLAALPSRFAGRYFETIRPPVSPHWLNLAWVRFTRKTADCRSITNSTNLADTFWTWRRPTKSASEGWLNGSDPRHHQVSLKVTGGFMVFVWEVHYIHALWEGKCLPSEGLTYKICPKFII